MPHFFLFEFLLNSTKQFTGRDCDFWLILYWYLLSLHKRKESFNSFKWILPCKRTGTSNNKARTCIKLPQGQAWCNYAFWHHSACCVNCHNFKFLPAPTHPPSHWAILLFILIASMFWEGINERNIHKQQQVSPLAGNSQASNCNYKHKQVSKHFIYIQRLWHLIDFILIYIITAQKKRLELQNSRNYSFRGIEMNVIRLIIRWFHFKPRNRFDNDHNKGPCIQLPAI